MIQGKIVNLENRNDYFNLSVSKLKTFQQCKAKYHFQYIQHLPSQEKDYLTFGTLLHKALEIFESEHIKGTNVADHLLMKTAFSKALKDSKYPVTPEQKQEAFEILSKFLEIRAKNKNALAKPLSVEKQFSIDVGDGVLLSGFIDLVKMDTDNILHVVDYKTSKTKQYLKKDLFQLKTYSYAMCLENEKLENIRTSYVMLKHNFDPITNEFCREDVLSIESEFRKGAAEINQEKLFRPSTGPLCKYCDYVTECPDGRDRVGLIKADGFGEVNW